VVGSELKKTMMNVAPWPGCKKAMGFIRPWPLSSLILFLEASQAAGGMGESKRPNKPSRITSVRRFIPERSFFILESPKYSYISPSRSCQDFF
jgi:hypothetical protein